MQVTYRLVEDDYRALARFLMHQSPRGRKTFRGRLVLALVLSIVAAGIVYSIKRDPILAVLFGGFFFVLTAAVSRRAAKLDADRIYRSILPQDDLGKRPPGTLKLLPEHLEAETRKGMGKIPWGRITQVGRDASHIYIIMGRENAFAIPRREFESPEAFEAFYQQAHEYHTQARSEAPPNAE